MTSSAKDKVNQNSWLKIKIRNTQDYLIIKIKEKKLNSVLFFYVKSLLLYVPRLRRSKNVWYLNIQIHQGGFEFELKNAFIFLLFYF